MSDLSLHAQKYALACAKTPLFSLVGLDTYARLVDCHDADTFSVVFELHGQLCRFSVRLAGCDGAEVSSKVPEIKRFALRGRNRFLQLAAPDAGFTLDFLYTKKEIQAKLSAQCFLVRLVCQKFDKYGRLLADAYCPADPACSIAARLVDEKYAKEYGVKAGKNKLTKDSWTEDDCG